MRFLVVTLAPTLLREDMKYYSYGPYVKEMDIWFENVDEVTIVSPIKYSGELLTQAFKRNDIDVVPIPNIAFVDVIKTVKSLLSFPGIFLKLIREMRKADHIHLRCPGNIGLIGCMAQVFFPKKTKTAKYAGNWDPKAKQPLSYRIQKWLLKNTFLTRNMQVLVYGEWPQQTKNIKSFFTASYPKEERGETISHEFISPFKFVFVGSLSPGKRPLYALKMVEELIKRGFDCTIDFYGDGAQRKSLENYIGDKNLTGRFKLLGNQSSETLVAAYKKADFLLLPSKSEGWPKAVAEAMFWGVIPLVTKISCVPWMLDHGNRGLLLDLQIDDDIKTIVSLLGEPEKLKEMSKKAQEWSQHYTLDDFTMEIKKLI